MTELRNVRVAAIQATPVILDAEASVAKAVRLLEEAAAGGAELAVLPETFIPLYPSNKWAKGAAGFGGWDELWEQLHANSVEVPGVLVDEIAAACERLSMHVVVGVNERDGGSLYNAYLLIGPEGLLHRHRKLMPTQQERLFHGIGAGDDLAPVETPLGRIGGLICWENRMPLARWAVYQGTPQIWCAPDRRRLRRLAGHGAPHRDRVRRLRGLGARSTSRAARSRRTSRSRSTATPSTGAAER